MSSAVPSAEVKRSSRTPVWSLTGVEITATGSYAPPQTVTNDDLARMYGCDAEWIYQRTGIRERRHAPPEIASSHLAIEAGRRCIERAGCDPGEIDLLLLATSTPDMHCPPTACQVQDALALTCGAVDMTAACSGFMYALATGMQYVANRCSRRTLVIGVDTMTRVVDPQAQKIYPLFGDGAGAVLLGPGTSEQGFAACTLGSDGSGVGLLKLPMCGSAMPASHDGVDQRMQFITMDGQAVFKWAVNLLQDQIPGVLAHAHTRLDEIDLFVFHQANLRILNAVADKLGVSIDKFLVNIDRYGNTTAGTVPLALDEAFDAGRIQRGSRLLLAGFGAGLGWGLGVLRW